MTTAKKPSRKAISKQNHESGLCRSDYTERKAIEALFGLNAVTLKALHLMGVN